MILSKRFLSEQAKRRGITEYGQTEIVNENVRLALKYDVAQGKNIKQYDIFLSHSSLDKKFVYTLVQLFNEVGYSVYVDWMVDTQLDRNNVNKDTAQVLRNRMNNSRGLSYVATTNSSNSKWCPWELGYFDGKKNGRCCILPIVESQTFLGQEYLGLYPFLDYEKNNLTGRQEFWVNNQDDGKYVTLKEWLAGKEPYIG